MNPEIHTALAGDVAATARLNIRSLPARTAPVLRRVDAGTRLPVRGLAKGESVSGVDEWYVGDGDGYFWSGACADFRPLFAADGTTRAPEVHRRANGTILPLSEAELATVFGRFDYTERPGGRIAIDPAWPPANIVSLATPLLAVTGYPSIDVHRKARDPFARAFAAIEAAGLGDRILTCAGTFVPRHKGSDPGRGLSSHSWAVAIDVNVAWNGYGRTPAAVGARGSVRELVPYFEAEGFAWGGYFRPPYEDGMHFELARLDV